MLNTHHSVGAVLLMISTVSLAQDNAALHRLAPVAKPLSQTVAFNLDPRKDVFSGSTVITLEVLNETSFIEVNGLDYNIETAKLNGKQFCNLESQMLKTGKVKLSCEHSFPKGRYTLTMDYTAPYNRKSVGLYKTIDNGVPYLFSQFQMSDARRAFPVFDEPEYKIPFKITITAPEDQKVFTNTPLLKTTKSKGLVTHYFDKTLPLPSYSLAIAVGPFEVLKVPGMSVPGNLITPQNKSSLAAYSIENTPKILTALEKYFDIPYVYKKLDQVAVPEFPFGAMENAGLVTYREDILLIDPARSTQRVRIDHLNIITHELAHQWYGNLVTMKWWNDLWLNEAFATWIASKITHQLHPELESNLALLQHYAMDFDAQATTSPIQKPINTEADIMDGLWLAYSKGSAILYMVEQWLGEDVFKQGMRNYVRQYAHKNAEAKDLWSALSKVSNKEVAAVLNSFVSQASFPLLTVEKNGATLTISQQRFAIHGQTVPSQTWHIPIILRYGKGEQSATTSLLLDAQSKQVTLAFEPEWILPNANVTGYYRWQLSSENLIGLTQHATSKLNTREKLDVLDNVEALLDAGKIDTATLMTTLGHYTNDDHPEVAKTALTSLLSQYHLYKENIDQKRWAAFFATYIEPAFKHYGLTATKEEQPASSEIRAQLIEILAFETKHSEIITHAKKQALLYLSDADKVDPYLVESFLKIAAYYGSAELLKAYQQQFESTNNPSKRTHLLSAMGYFGEPALQQEMLKYALTKQVTASDLGYILAGNKQGKARKARYQKWFYNNFTSLKTKLPPFAVPRLPFYLFSRCDTSHLNQAKQFFEPMRSDIDGLEKSLQQLELATKTCVNKKQRELSSITAFLNQLS
ncbi:M1 family metallopeptidase [Pseudoalteromonas sp. McH1-7]|uniref:M1 family metallopeptidase n=1 Tax=Pseudoalteromonas sp. McH1-7 TaxID=2745574 RepID=UPI001590A7A7|nr:M1 family metallopeptidase [Pseudoalteromonas sp. McH1-7]NUZ11225.1 M1 family metallopeptidase [Pseudoalteromonas sp. McH1-7]